MEKNGVDGVENLVCENFDAVFTIATNAVHDALELVDEVSFFPAADVNSILHPKDVRLDRLVAELHAADGEFELDGHPCSRE